VRITGGSGSPDDDVLQGGAVFNQGILTLIDAKVTGNQAEKGGGILNAGSADLILDNTAVTSNTAISDDPQLATFGGGIFNDDGTVTLDAQSAVVDNDPNNCVGTEACPA
jgi:hypothetical protein